MEGEDAPAAIAVEVVMVLPARLGRLVGRNSGAHVEPVHQAELLELLEGAVDAGAAHAWSGASKLVLDLLGAQRTRLTPQTFDNRASRRPFLIAGLGEARQGVLDPVPVNGWRFDLVPRSAIGTRGDRVRRRSSSGGAEVVPLSDLCAMTATRYAQVAIPITAELGARATL